MLANNQLHPMEMHRRDTAILIFEVEVRTRVREGPFPSTIQLVRVEGDQETIVAETRITSPIGL